MRFLLTSLCLYIVSYASTIEVYGTKSTIYNLQTQKRSYSIVAKEYIIDIDALKKEYNYFNRKEIVRAYHYRRDGILIISGMEVLFDRAYYFDGSLICENSIFWVDGEQLKARECSYKDEKLTCKKIRYIKNGNVVKTKMIHSF